MKHLRLFETEAAFEAEKANLPEPWVALTEDDEKVYFGESGEPQPTIEFVDLGLPSGLKWAKCNIGAESETDYGKYFQWGDTVGYADGSHSTWETAPFNNGSSDFDGDYFNAHKSEWLDGDVLKPEYDAVYQATNGAAHMPTQADFQELIDNTYNEWVEDYEGSGVNGYLFRSMTDMDKYIFIPATGYTYYGSLEEQGSIGGIWGSSLDTRYPLCAWCLLFYSGGQGISSSERLFGYSVRGVKD